MRVWPAPWVLTLLACGSSVAPLDAFVPADADVCRGPRPALAACVRGAAWAECGGSSTGEPHFACANDCYWFTGPCLAEGYLESACPVDDVCCDHAELPGAIELSNLVYGWGRQPWDRARERNVAVTVAPTSAGSRPFVSCAVPASPNQGPCTGGTPSPSVLRGFSGALVVRILDARYAMDYQEISIEVTRDADASLHAKVCVVPSTDVSIPSCGPGGGTPLCATSGTLTLPSFPTTQAEASVLPIDVSALLPDGSRIELRL